MKFNATLLGFAACAAISFTAVAEVKWPTPLPPNPLLATNAAAKPVADSAPATAAADSAATTNAQAEVTTATNAVVVVVPVATNAPADAPATTNVVVVVTPATVSPASAPAAALAAPAPADAGAHDPGAIIPLIVMDEVPLIDAIKNLARQAGLNYMLDPKITQLYGAADANGVVHAQPNVSLRWENLTADQALSAVLNNNNLVILDDPKTKIARITVKDPTAPDPLVTKIIQLKYSSPSNMVVNTSSILTDKRSKVIADTRTSQLVVVATEKELNSIDELVARLDTPTKQVLIEARIVETSKNPTSSKGVDWSGTLQAQHVTFGNGNTAGTYATSGTASTGTTYGVNSGSGSLPVGALSPPYIGANPSTVVVTSTAPGGGSQTFANNPFTGGPSLGATSGNVNGTSIISALTSTVGAGGLSANTAQGFFPYTAFLNADGASAVLSFLNNNFDATVLSTPRAVTLDNEEATLSVTVAQPIFLTTAGTQGSPGGSQVNYTNLGTILKVTPRISANNTINLKVVPEVSDIAGTITKTVGGLVNQADVFDIRRIETHVLIPSGNTLVMGGLVSDNRSKNNTKVPIFGDIPLLGAAFRSESKTQNKQNLIIFVTPTIVQPEDFQPTESSFLKTKVPNLKAADFGAWDSSEPQDWSKLTHTAKKVKGDDVGDIPTTN